MKKQVRLTENDLKKVVKESVNILLNEMPTGKKIQFRNDKRDVWYKFASRARNKNFGLCKSDQRQLGMMYAEAFYKDREDLAEKIYNYACGKQWEYGRLKSNGDEELCERIDFEMMEAFQQGEREYDNSDIWTDDDPNFNGPGGYEDSIYQFESKRHSDKSVNEISGRMYANDGKNFTPKAKPDDEEKDKKGWGKKKDKELGDWYESKSYLRKVVKESINRVLNEGLKGVDPNNVVPEDLARQYGFESEYADRANGLELWGKDIPNDNPKRLLYKLGIRNFTSISNNATGMHVRITVKPNPRSGNMMQTPKKIGDYESTGYGDKDGEIMHNLKNGHFKRRPFGENRNVNEVKMKGSDGFTYPDLHGNDPDAWRRVNYERAKRIRGVNNELERQQQDGYVGDLFGDGDDLKKERYRNLWNIARNNSHRFEVDSPSPLDSYQYPGVDNTDPEDRKEAAQLSREKLNQQRPDMSIKTRARVDEPKQRLRLNQTF